MSNMKWINAEKSLKDFIEKDLSVLIAPHCQDVIHVITEYLKQAFDISIDIIVADCPDFIYEIHQLAYRYFQYHLKKAELNRNSDFYACYGAIAAKFQDEGIYTLIELQLSNINIQDIIRKHSSSYIISI